MPGTSDSHSAGGTELAHMANLFDIPICEAVVKGLLAAIGFVAWVQ